MINIPAIKRNRIDQLVGELNTGSCSIDRYGAEEILIATQRIISRQSWINRSGSLFRTTQTILDGAEKVALAGATTAHSFSYISVPNNELIAKAF